MLHDDAETTCLILVDEWVVGDLGIVIHIGDDVDWRVGPPEEEALRALGHFSGVEHDPATSEPLAFALQPTDPEPPIQVTGRVVEIAAVRYDVTAQPEFDHPISVRVAEARVNWGVDHYVLTVAGTIRPLG
jgi:hypothetical protein